MVQSELSVMSHAIGHGAMAETFPAGARCTRDKAAGARDSLGKGVCKCQTYLDIAVQRNKN